MILKHKSYFQSFSIRNLDCIASAPKNHEEKSEILVKILENVMFENIKDIHESLLICGVKCIFQMQK